jgi:energy-coupling factor transport system permease protein
MTDTAGTIRYTAGSSWMHRLSPIPKLAWLLAVVVVAFASFDPRLLAAITVGGLLLAASAGIAGSAVRTLVTLAPLAAAIVVLQAIAPAICGTSCTPAAHVGVLTVYEEGVARGLTFIVRILAMEGAAIVVLQTTHPSDLVAGLGRLRVPYLLTVMVALTLQLVPVLQAEVRTVLAAQRARGLRGTGVGAVIPALVPVFAGTVERVQQLAIGLESRGFGASGPRTSYRRIGFSTPERALAVVGVLAGIVGVVASIAAGASGAATLNVSAGVAVAVFAVAAVVFVAGIARAVLAIART